MTETLARPDTAEPTDGPPRGASPVEATLVIPRQPHEFSNLAGGLVDVPDDEPYRVRYRSLTAAAGARGVAGAVSIALLGVAFDVLFVFWLLSPAHMEWQDDHGAARFADVFLIASIAVIEVFRLLNLISLALASVLVRDPVPVTPPAGLRVAFLTTIVPGKEPIDMVRRTLAAATRIHYDTGVIDVWLLDEGDDPAVKRMCAELGVRHFTRRYQGEYNTVRGEFKARTKHGNYNAWLDRFGHRYDVMLSVDPDHVPLPCYAERMLGYFRDPDVAFVCGPQTYANQDTFVTRGAESQQFPFHGLIQRAANRNRAGMLVGTNNAIRIKALWTVGGLQDSITEDMATGLLLHSRRNPETGRRWDSVYTPDVVALGEGPSSWGDYFGQQLRWSRGTLEILRSLMWRRLIRLSPGRAVHYLLLTSFYPAMALSWVLGCVNAILCLTVGATGLVVSPTVWLALYVDVMATQVWMFVRNRRYNVSPYEADGSPGLTGVLMSLLCAPLFARALMQTILRRPAKFVVTPKNAASSSDHWLAFRTHLTWCVLLVAALVVALARNSLGIEILLWPLIAVAICLVPVANWLLVKRRQRAAAVPRAVSPVLVGRVVPAIPLQAAAPVARPNEKEQVAS